MREIVAWDAVVRFGGDGTREDGTVNPAENLVEVAPKDVADVEVGMQEFQGVCVPFFELWRAVLFPVVSAISSSRRGAGLPFPG
jgi:hypothetical protein